MNGHGLDEEQWTNGYQEVILGSMTKEYYLLKKLKVMKVLSKPISKGILKALWFYK